MIKIQWKKGFENWKDENNFVGDEKYRSLDEAALKHSRNAFDLRSKNFVCKTLWTHIAHLYGLEHRLFTTSKKSSTVATPLVLIGSIRNEAFFIRKAF